MMKTMKKTPEEHNKYLNGGSGEKKADNGK